MAKVGTGSMLQEKKIQPSGQLIIFSDWYYLKTKRATHKGVSGSDFTN